MDLMCRLLCCSQRCLRPCLPLNLLRPLLLIVIHLPIQHPQLLLPLPGPSPSLLLLQWRPLLLPVTPLRCWFIGIFIRPSCCCCPPAGSLPSPSVISLYVTHTVISGTH